MEEREVGKVIHYFGKIGVVAIKLIATLAVGDTIHVKGRTSDFTQKVESIQIENDEVQSANAGDAIGLKVVEHAREHDVVSKMLP